MSTTIVNWTDSKSNWISSVDNGYQTISLLESWVPVYFTVSQEMLWLRHRARRETSVAGTWYQSTDEEKADREDTVHAVANCRDSARLRITSNDEDLKSSTMHQLARLLVYH
jgi:hypothetical protein